MTSPEFHYWRSKVGGLVRDRAEDDPELVEAKERMAEEAFIAAVTAALKKAPPMTPEIRERVIALLSCKNEPQVTATPRGLTTKSQRRVAR